MLYGCTIVHVHEAIGDFMITARYRQRIELRRTVPVYFHFPHMDWNLNKMLCEIWRTDQPKDERSTWCVCSVPAGGVPWVRTARSLTLAPPCPGSSIRSTSRATCPAHSLRVTRVYLQKLLILHSHSDASSILDYKSNSNHMCQQGMI